MRADLGSVKESEPDQLRAEWAAFLPAGFDCSLVPVADQSARLIGGEVERIAGAHPRRIASFSSGRLAARAALRLAGFGGAPPEIGSDQGAPVPPEGYVLSITHTDDYAVAVAGPATRAVGLGIDLERYERIDPAWRRHLVRPIDRIPAAADRLELAMVFSLRESLFKALSSAGLGDLFETTALDWDAAAGVPRPAPGGAGEARLVWGVRTLGAHVLTFCAVQAKF